MKIFKNIIFILAIVIPLFSQEDIKPPTLEDFSFSPSTADVTNEPVTVTITANITDDLSGLDYALVYFKSPSGNQYEFCQLNTQNNIEDVIIIEQYAEGGIWYVDYVQMYDNVGNSINLYTDDLEDAGFETILMVNSLNCTASDGTNGVTLWGECYSIENTTTLNLGNSNLSGPIPAGIGELINLTQLILNGNQLTGEIPVEIGNLTNLLHLEMQWNEITGPIPSTIGNLTNLTILGMGSNNLTESIPSEISNLVNLTHLNLWKNNLSGEIPLWIGNLVNLTTLGLHDNQLTGEIPSTIGNLTNLANLYLKNNQLTGMIPPEIYNLTNLAGLYLSDNQLSGTISQNIGNMNLNGLNLSNNELSGQIPSSICDLTNCTIYIYNNYLCPPYPECIEDNIGPQNISNCGPSTWYVSNSGSDDNDGSAEYPFANIQFALDTAAPNDTVLVSAGIYDENIIWPSTNEIKLIGSGIDDCIIDGSQNGSVIVLGANITDTKITGFTIQNGFNDEDGGGGISLTGSSPILENLLINDNSGSGIVCWYGANPLLQNMEISNNTSGGIMCYVSNPSLNNVVISNNTGSGMYSNYSDPILTNVTISSNSEHGFGCSSCSASLNNVLIINNLYAGVHCYDDGFPTLTNVTISNNNTGILCVYNNSPTLLNSIVWYNQSDEIYNAENFLDFTIDYSNIAGGWVDSYGNPGVGVGNIDADPLFCNSGNEDYTIAENSPCSGTGEDGANMGALGVGCDEILSSLNGVEIPETYALSQNYPNPFNPTTTITYDIPVGGVVHLAVYNINGQLIETLVNGHMSPGYYSVVWGGEELSAGSYFYRLLSGGKTITNKMILIK